MTTEEWPEAAENSRRSYNVAVEAMRERLEKSKVQIGPHVLYCEDAEFVLPTLGRFDACVTDPPYGIGLNTDNTRFSGGNVVSIRRRGNGIGPAQGKPITGDDVPFDPSIIMKVARDFIVWGWNNFPDKLPRGACLVWLKRNDDAFGSFLSDAELAWMSKGHGVYCRRDLSNNAIAFDRTHPTQKPVSLMEWCLSFLPSSCTILDPFMGSGTTGVACVKMGKIFTGIERERKYFDIACRRIEQAMAQADLFIEQPKPAKPVQEALNF